MRSTRLASFLQVRAGEGRMAALIAALFGLIEAGRGIGANAADALFFRRFGVDNLPVMIVLLGVASFLVALTYTAALGRVRKNRFFTGVMLALPAALLAERAAILLNWPLVYPVLWITVNIVASILGILMWNIAGDACDARQAKRLFPLFTSASIVGGVLGNFVTGPVANLIQTENLLLVVAALLFAGFLITGAIVRRFLRVEARRGPRAGFLDDVRVGFDVVRASPLLRLMALSAVLFSVLYFSVSFPFSKAAAAAFPDEAEVAGFLGTFSGVATAVTFLVSLFVANRLYARFGVVNGVLLLTLTYLAGFVLFAASFTLTTAVIARAAQQIVLVGIAGSAWGTLFNTVPAEKRGQAIAFDNGVSAQLGTIASGILLVLGERVLTLAHVFSMGMIAAALCAALVWRMRRAYGDALVEALRAGRYEVFTAGDRAFAGFRGDAAALNVVRAALRDPRPATRRLAAQVLSRMGATAAAPWLMAALRDPEADVRGAAVDALSDLGAREAAGDLVVLLGDPDAGVRACALRALPHLQAQVTPALTGTLEILLRETDLDVRAQAAVALVRFGEPERGLPTLDALLRDPDAGVRCRALGALEAVAASGHRFDLEPVLHALGDGTPRVRRAACQALGRTRDAAAIEPLVACLGDRDTSVRRAAADALSQFGSAATGALIEVLRGQVRGGPDGGAVDAVLDALHPGDADLAGPLHDFAHHEIGRAKRWREAAASIPPTSRVTRFLRELIEARAAHSEQRLVKAVGLLGHREAMAWVGRGLKSHDAETRAAAVETLEMLGDKHLAKEIIPLLESGPQAGTMTLEAALTMLFEDGDRWLRAFAARAAVELQARGLDATLQSVASHSDPLVRDAAREALSQRDEVKPMETLQTVSLMERLMLLRDVPLFADLSPDDLKQIADVAREHAYSSGALMCREGEDGHEMFVLASGQVQVVKAAGGGEKIIAARTAGDFIGEMAIVESQPRSASVRAVGDVRALVIDGDAFKAILRDRPEVSLALLKGLSRRLREKE